jgi:hypothetical protein
MSIAISAAAVGPGGWDHVGVGATSALSSLNGAVTALDTENPGVLYAGGGFTSAGGNTKAARIARWNGSTWSSLGNTPIPNGGVYAIAYHAGKVYAGGTFVDVGGNPLADFLVVWNGSTWAPFCTTTMPGHATFNGNVNALQIIGNTLYVGGSFQDGAGIAAADYLLACDLTTGASSATVDSTVHSFSGSVYALTADSNGTLYAGGTFINLEAIPQADHVAAYAGFGIWTAMGTGPGVGGSAVDSVVRSLTAHGTNMYVGTDSLNVGSMAEADHVARWDGVAWHAVGANTANTDGWFPTSASIDALSTYGSYVIAAGSFQNANGIATADTIAYFDGTRWRPIGSDGAGNGPLNAYPTALGVTNGRVYVGGNFTAAGGDTRAKWIAAYALRLPDSSIGVTSTGHYVGNNVYSPTGVGESRSVTITKGKTSTFYVKVQNDGIVAAPFSVKGTGGAHGITVRYYRGATNITTHVRAGTYYTGTIAARASVLLRMVVVTAHSSAASTTFVTTAKSSSGTPSDAVRLLVKTK